MAHMVHVCTKCDKDYFNNELLEPQKCECGNEQFIRTSDEDNLRPFNDDVPSEEEAEE